MRWRPRRSSDAPGRPGLAGTAAPEQVRAALVLARAERLLAAARAGRDSTGHVWLLATTWRLATVTETGELGWARPWHEVDVAAWSREANELTVTFVDERRPLVFPFGQEGLFLQVLRERVQASVVSSVELPLPGRRPPRAVLRHDLATGELVEQLVGAGGRTDAAAAQAAREAFNHLREEVGMPPLPPLPPDAAGTPTAAPSD